MGKKTRVATLARPGVAAFAGGLFAVAAISLGIAETRSGDGITLCVATTCPTTPKATDCGAFPGTTTFKIEDPSRTSSGPYTDGAVSIEISVNHTSLGETFDWTSTLPVGGVVVKGGPDRNVYTYDPARMSDGGLHAPMNETNGRYPDLSYVAFCYLLTTPTPTGTPTPTETPGGSPTPTPADTPGGSPTPTPAETPTPSPTPTPSVSPTPTPTPVPNPAVGPLTLTPAPTRPPQVLGRELPRSGTYVLAAIAVALACVAFGLKLIDVRRRRETR